MVMDLRLTGLGPSTFASQRSVALRMRLVSTWRDSRNLSADVTVRLNVNHLLIGRQWLVQWFIAHAIKLCLACWSLGTVCSSTEVWDVYHGVIQFGLLYFIQIQISRYALREGWHGAVHGLSLRINCCVLGLWHVDGALIHLLGYRLAHSTVLLGFAVIQHDLRVRVVVILYWIAKTFHARPASRHRRVLLLGDTSRRLLVYLNLL